MRTALCLSGQIRCSDRTIQSLKEKIIDKYNCDVFIHTWRDKGHVVPHHYIENYQHKYREIDYSFIEEYNPKKIKIEYPNYNMFKVKTLNSRFYNTLMMWYGIYQANELRKEYEIQNNVMYNCVIRCRFDLFFENFTIPVLKNNTIYLPPNENINQPFSSQMRKMLERLGESYMPNDQFAYGNSSSMDYYCSIHKILSNDLNYYPHHPEELLSHHLWSKNKSKILPKINNLIQMKILR